MDISLLTHQEIIGMVKLHMELCSILETRPWNEDEEFQYESNLNNLIVADVFTSDEPMLSNNLSKDLFNTLYKLMQ